MNKKKIALIANYGMDFLLSREPYLRFLESKGFEVYAIVPEDDYTQILKDKNIKVLPYKLERNSLSLLPLIRTISVLRKYNKSLNFSVTHSFGLQSNIINNLSFGSSKRTYVVNHITGLGFSFTRKSIKARVLKSINLLAYQILFLFSDKIITQNNDDKNILSNLFFVKNKFKVINGSGVDHLKMSRKSVDLNEIDALKKELFISEKSIVITYVGRLVAEKGINEFIAMAKKLSQVNQHLKFFIIGWLDTKNPTCVSKSEIEELRCYPNIAYLGKRLDIREILFLTNIYVLPTYREGFPRSILEAMSMELPVVTCDVTGARDAIKNGLNGLLVPVQDVDSLIKSTQNLISSSTLRTKFGVEGRKRVENEFCSEIIFQSFLNSYS